MANASNNTTSPVAQKPVAASPWDEEIDVPEEPKGPMITGNLAPKILKPEEKPAPFNIPENLEEKIGQKVPAEQYIESNQPNSPASSQPKTNDGVAALIQEKKPASVEISPGVVIGSEKNLTAQKPADKTVFVANQIGKNITATKTPVPESLPKIKGKIKLLNLAIIRSKPVLIVLGILMFLVGTIAGTEMGIISVGAEKIYGPLAIERFWGGLGNKPIDALAISTIRMKNHPDFKAQGNITLTIDKSIQSPVTSPLVAFGDSSSMALDERIAQTTKAILTQSLDSSDYISSDLTGTSVTTTTSQDQSDYQSYQPQGWTAKDIPADVKAVFGTTGGQVDLTVKKVTGNYNMSLISLGDKLYLKSDTSLNYGQSDAASWLEYRLSPMEDKIPQSEFFSMNTGKGFSVKGSRTSNEKVGGVRTYKYHIASLEVGSSFSSFGISSDMVQSVNGDIWVGIKDKLIRKINLNVATSPSAAVSNLSASLEFYDFDKTNAISAPENAVAAGGEDNTTTGGDTLNQTNDEHRKADLVLIQTALAAHKQAKGSYPVAATLTKLNTASNILGISLVPSYIAILPADPKSIDGWYYAYKSVDGINYSLSARLEDSTDPEATNAGGGVFLYYVYNSK